MRVAHVLVAVSAWSSAVACSESVARPEAPAMSNSSIGLKMSPDEVSVAEEEARHGSADAALRLARHYGELTLQGASDRQVA